MTSGLAIGLLGWFLLLSYIFYEFQEYGPGLFTHIFSSEHASQAVFHTTIFLLPFITTYLGYLIGQKDKLLKKAEAEKARGEAFVEAVGDAISIQDTNFRIIFQNRLHREMMGSHPGEYCYEAYQGREDVCEGCHLAITFKDGKIHSKEQKRMTPSGIRYFEITASPLTDSGGNVTAAIEAVRDITDRKRTEEELAKRGRAIEASIDGIVFTDLNGTIRHVNRAFVAMWGYREENTCLGKSVIEFWRSPEEAETVIREVKEKGSWSGESVARRKDGSFFDVQLSAVTVLDNEGKPVGLMASCGDITDRKQAVEALRESEERFRSLSNASLEGLMVHDRGVILDANAAFARLFGYGHPEELIGKNGPELLLTPSSRARILQRIARQEGGLLEVTGIRKDGSTFQAETESQPAKYLGRDVRIVACRDITERKRAEEEHEKLQAQLYQSQKMESVGRLAGGVAHDFNNMLSAILGHAELAVFDCSPSDPLRAHLRVIEQSALRSADLVRQLLAFARKQTVAPEILDLNDTVAGLLKMLRRLIGEDINFAWMPGAGLWPVKIDPSQIDQLLANLCVNARDAIEGVGKITIETENAVLDEAYCETHPGTLPGQYVMLAVSDDGSGISKEVRDHLFEPFFTTKEAGKGTGLGLATVYGIVKQNEGVINVYSEPGKGSTFKIYLPRFVGRAVQPAAETAAETPRGQGETVLLVEDEAVILDVGRTMLERLGYRVLTAGTPTEALREARAHVGEIRLLVTDVIMPEMNGRALAKVLAEINPGLKCLFSSGYTADVIAHRGVLDEGVHFLQKPFSRKDLAIKVREALEG